MRKQEVMGLLFSNMHDEAVRELTAGRAMGSVPFGGRYRLIDFALSNMVNAGISKVGVITKNNYQSLMDHLGSGKAWDLSRKNQGLYILPPYGSSDQLYEGRIASLSGILPFLRNSREEYVILSDCHVVGNIDYSRLLEAHVASGAEVTVGYQRGVPRGLKGGVILQVAPDGRIQDMRLGLCSLEACDYGLGLYVMKKEFLMRTVDEAVSRNRMNFERDVLQRHLEELVVYGYRVPEYAAPIDSLDAYFRANMALLQPEVRRELFLTDRPVYTKVRDSSPALYGLHSCVTNSLVADGASIEGTVSNSIIFRDVRIERGTCLNGCIIMQGSLICERTHLDYVLTDKNVVIRNGRVLRGFDSYPVFIAKGSVV